MGNPPRDGMGLARSRTGEDHEGPGNGGGNGPLLIVEPGQWIDIAREPAATRLRDVGHRLIVRPRLPDPAPPGAAYPTRRHPTPALLGSAYPDVVNGDDLPGTAEMLTMYSTRWCGYCHRLKGQLARAGVAYREIDIEADPVAAAFVASVNGGNETVPTLALPDGSTLTNPTLDEVLAALRSATSPPEGDAPPSAQ